MGSIYIITNLINNKVYIGKTVRLPEERFKEHIRDARSNKCKNSKLQRAINKYGSENFVMTVIESNISNDELSQKERDYIRLYNSYYDGYNTTFGGDGESQVDIDIIESLFLQGKNCIEIHNITGYSIKTITSHLKANGYNIINHQGNKDKGKKMIFDNKEFSSSTLLAQFLKENYKEFAGKKTHAIISGVCRSAANNKPYCGYYFYYVDNKSDLYKRTSKNCSSAKLTEEDVKYIRNNYIPRNKEFGCRGLARRFNVHHSVISDIVNKKSWKYIV